MHKNGPRLIPLFFMVANIIAALLLMVSAYGGNVSPIYFGWLPSITLAFPVVLALNIALMLLCLIVRSRKWLVCFIAICVSSVAIRTYFPVNLPQSAPKGSIKVVSYNLFGYGYGVKDNSHYEQMLDYLRNSKADILCAQEAHYDAGHKSAIEKAVAHWRYRDSVQVISTYNALTLYSNFPIIDRHVIRSSSPSHLCAIYRLKVKSDTVVVVNSHFVSNSISADDKSTYNRLVKISDGDSTREDILRLCDKVNVAGRARAEQADFLAEYLDRFRDKPIIVCGDFNDSPLSYTHHRITSLLSDAHTASANGFGFSYHEHRMYFRLDNILYSRHWRAYSAKVDSKYKMSDHYPIEAWLKRVNVDE